MKSTVAANICIGANSVVGEHLRRHLSLLWGSENLVMLLFIFTIQWFRLLGRVFETCSFRDGAIGECELYESHLVQVYMLALPRQILHDQMHKDIKNTKTKHIHRHSRIQRGTIYTLNTCWLSCHFKHSNLRSIALLKTFASLTMRTQR